MERLPSSSASWDVIVLGGGPAGSVSARLLAAAGCRVLILDKPRKAWNIGETLPPQAHRILSELGLTSLFAAGPHRPAPGIVSIWGHADPVVRDFLFSPYGNGFHIDRDWFNGMLVEAALSEGASVLRAAVASCERQGGAWLVRLASGDAERTVRCRLIIDATGRSPSGLGGFPPQLPSDRLIAVACLCPPAPGSAPSDYTLIEAVDEGWFYAALMPSGKWVVAYMTDADLYAAGARSSPHFFASQLEKSPHIRARVAMPHGKISMFPARSSVRSRAALPGWLAVGDAARSQDPLSGQGIIAALTMAREAKTVALKLLQDDLSAAEEWELSNRLAFDKYRQTRDWYYGQEQRWPQSPFWHRRHTAQFSIHR